MFVLVLPGIWVAVVLALQLAVPEDIQLAPLLAAAPAIACAGTGRRQCVLLAGLCALVALLPIRSGSGSGTAGLGERVGTFGAIIAVAVAAYVISRRRLRVLRDVTQVWSAAEEAQRVLLRPSRDRVADVQAAAGWTQAGGGAPAGGVFYEVLETVYGVRALVGAVRGGDRDAVERAAVVLGSFREAAYEESDLCDLMNRLDVSLRRHLGQAGGGTLGAPGGYPEAAFSHDSGDLWRLSDLLTRTTPPPVDADRADLAEVSVVSLRSDGRVEIATCGPCAPLLIRSGVVTGAEGYVSAFDNRGYLGAALGVGDSVVLVAGATPTTGLAGALGPPAHLKPDLPASRILAAVTTAMTAGGAAGCGAAVLVLRRVAEPVSSSRA